MRPLPWRARLIEWRDGLALPERFSADVVDPKLGFSVRVGCHVVDGRPVCTSLVLEGDELTSRGLRRARLMDYVGLAAATVAIPVGAPGRAAVSLDRHAVESRHGGRHRLDDEHLERVAKVHRQAKADGKPAIRALRRAFPSVSASTLARWTREARRRGLLA